MSEFKIGDRVRLEGVITDLDHIRGAWIGFKGHAIKTLLSPKEMDNAEIIEPEIKDTPQENVSELDLTKPMRIKCLPDVKVNTVFGPSKSGFCMIDHSDGINICHVNELENIPEPKITTSDVLSLWEFKTGARVFMWGDAAGCATRLSQVRVSYTEGEGWSIEEINP